jgi:hypothetical protein
MFALRRYALPRRRQVVLGLVVVGLVFAPSASVAALPPGCSQSGQTVTCTYLSGSNPFAVPAGVSFVHVMAVGGGGASAPGGSGGGHGAVVSGDVPAIAGTTLYAVVGGNATRLTMYNGGIPGANGGGDKGVTVVRNNIGGSGGGASDVRSSQNDLSSRLLVAAGGGGGGGSGFCNVPLCSIDTTGQSGGAGGGYDGAGDPAFGGGGGGRGGSSGGGAGGTGGACQALTPCSPGGGGGDGVLGSGGAGGSGALAGANGVFELGGGGGGAGGGLFGGGGGGGGLGGGGGGGGGSNLVPAGGSQSVDTTGIPLVRISYTVLPTSKSQCKHGGWRNYPQFKNQGQCVAFVVNRARQKCLAERAKIGLLAFRNKYGLGPYHVLALRRCVNQASR